MSRSSQFGADSHARWVWMVAAAVVGVATAALATLAIAQTTKPTLKTAHNAAVKATIVVDSRGLTLYELKPETNRHLLCTSKPCFKLWPPLKVSRQAKLVRGAGVKGRLAKLHRAGFYQVTLDGRPLYHFFGDKAKGQAHGQGLVGFGGTWHVVKAGSSSKSTTSGTSTTSSHTSTTKTTTTSTYTYPY